MTFDRAYEYSRSINAKMFLSDRFKMGGFGYSWYRSLGIPSDDLLTLSKREIRVKYNISQLLEEKKAKYRISLLKL